MTADRIAVIERDADGTFVACLVSTPGAVAGLQRRAEPGHTFETRPARPGETTMTLAAEIAAESTDPNATVSRMTLPIHLTR